MKKQDENNQDQAAEKKMTIKTDESSAIFYDRDKNKVYRANDESVDIFLDNEEYQDVIFHNRKANIPHSN
jgi:hypothetical protein